MKQNIDTIFWMIVGYFDPGKYARGWCALDSKGTKHENCRCPMDPKDPEDIKHCREDCENDEQCLGYSHSKHTCALYTLSDCNEGCKKSKLGNKGEIFDFSRKHSDEFGCFIKKRSKLKYETFIES